MKLYFELNLKVIALFILLVLFTLNNGCKSNTVSDSQILGPNHFDTHVDILKDIEDRGLIRIGTTGDFMPFTYQLDDDNGAFYGIDIELGVDLAKSLGVEVKFVKTSWPSLLSDLENGLFDICMSGVTIKLDRQKVGLFSIPSMSGGKAAIVRDEDVQKYKSIAAINQTGVRVIVNPGGTNEVFALANFPNAQIIFNKDNLSIFQRIVDGEADVMVTDAIETLIQEMIHPELEAVNPSEPFNFFEMGYLLPRDLFWKAYVDQWLHFKLKDGSYQKIYDQELLNIKMRATEGKG